MRDFYLGLKLMLSYFTVLPVRFGTDDDLSKPAVLAGMLFWLPLGGLILGMLSLGIYTLLASLGWVAGVVAVIAYMMLYGFLHTEAVMDVADALYAKHSGKDAYEIIKEPTVGAMGVLWAVGVMLMKVSGGVYLLTHDAFGLFLVAVMISRMGLLTLFFTQSFRSTFITTMQQGFTPRIFWTSMLLFGSIGVLLAEWHFLLLLAIGLGFAYLFATHITKKLGFMNGDVLGTTLETSETLLFLFGGALWL
ncbi:MAG: adenosylcobinamide-GDP ribazoletransferase [Sulfurovum sp.]|nr:adenosylcobinamide-GDP ribazoletransferase [Sulfurovum sp.]